MPRKAKNSDFRHSGLAELGTRGGRLTSIDTPAVIPPFAAMALRASVRAAADLLLPTRERGMSRPPRLNSVTFCQGLSV